ncbi:flagellin N-terminal helical domain-containing protein [Modestobacter marinus]|uniref:Flagellin n=1 Tax=Modestobacter marinus TaxID=477641 RepID=A0A846LUX4_9ACTN|nr:flagellin [Modestobacter marinus]NIH70194.1 flagellin [Modestobacter marinus]
MATNTSAMAAHRHLARTDGALHRSLERLSSGHRVNRAADDAAGLGISEGLRAQIGGMARAVRNTQDGISLVQTAEGALAETTALLQRMRDLAVQAANDGGLDAHATRAIQGEVDQLKAELDRIAGTTTFNGRRLLDGTYRGTFQVGADVGETLTVVIGSAADGVDVAGLGLSGVDVSDPSGAAPTATVTPAVSDAEGTPSAGRLALAGDFTTTGSYAAGFRGLSGTISYAGRTFDLASVDYTGAVTATDHITALNLAARPALGTATYPFVGTGSALYFTGDVPAPASTAADAVALTPAYTARTGPGGALPVIDAALSRVSSLRADLGAVQNRMEHTIARLGVSIENTTAAESRIRDTDMAAEMTVFARNQVLSQAGTAMLAQANQTPRAVLELLG